MTEQPRLRGAVFLSYSSQDVDAASRICESLRQAGVEVWLDRAELRGGEFWDAQIKKQIHECALFVPVISARTNARAEGYFRREWNLARRRLLDMADDLAFLVPVVIDETRESDARVPEEFLRAQWTWLPFGETTPAFAQRVRQLLYLDRDVVPTAQPATASTWTIEPSVQNTSLVGPRGTPRLRRVGVIVMALGLLLGGGTFWYYQRASDPNATAPKLTAVREAISLRLAVLPLENLSPESNDAFFADGLHDEILSAMSATPELQVVSRTTMRTYAGTQKTVKQLAAELGASHLLEGTVRRAGEKVRLTLKLVDTASDSNVWSRTFDRQLTDALNLQSEVAVQVATALGVRLSPANANDDYPVATNTSVPTIPIAYDLYLKGKVQLASYSQVTGPPGFDRLEGLVTRAIELDPGFAKAYTLRARVLLSRLWYLCDLTTEQWRMIGSDIAAARRLAGDTADVLAAESYFEYFGKMNYAHALETTRAAVEQYPNDLDLRQLEAYLLRRLGRWDDSIAVLRSLVEREPANAAYAGALAETLVPMRKYDQVLDTIKEYERHGAPDSFIASYSAYANEAIARDPEAQRRYLDTWRDRVEPSIAWIIEQDYLRNAGRADALAAHLIAARVDFIADSERFGSGMLMPVAGLQGYGRLLQGAASAPAEARALSIAAARISRLPSREWNIALLEAHSSLFSGNKRRAVEQANRALELMTVERDALLAPMVIGAAAAVMAWAGRGNMAVELLRQASAVPNFLPAWAMVRDPILAVPLAGNPNFEALKREFDPSG